MNKLESTPFKSSPLQVAQQETAQHVGDVVAREPERSPVRDKVDGAALPPVDPRLTVTAESHADDAALMSEWSIRFDGRRYTYGGYRYGRLADAVGYAKLMRARQLPDPGAEISQADERFEPPGAADRQLMAAHSVSFKAGVFEFSGYRYDHLSDALNYARLTERAQVSNRGKNDA